MAALPCPGCKVPLTPRGKALVCDRCGGQWLSESALAARLAEAGIERPPPLPRSPEPTPRRCPYCDGALAPLSMAGVALDQCAEHGLWLDPGELEELRGEAPASEERSGFWGALRDLIWFGS